MTTYVIDAVRAPRGKGRAGGALNGLRPVDMVRQLFDALGERTGAQPGQVDGVALGCVTQTGDQGGNIAQTAALYAGWDTAGSAVTVNSFCTSGLTACADAIGKSEANLGEVFVVGGVESMSRVPMMSDNGPIAADKEVAAALPFIPNPVAADFVAALEGFSQDEIDSYGLASHQKAADAAQGGRFAKSMIAMKDADGAVLLDHDESVRAGLSAQKFAELPRLVDPAKAERFVAKLRELHPQVTSVVARHHAGVAPGMVDGASLALLASEAGVRKLARPPRARIRAYANARGPTTMALTGGIAAAQQALSRAGMKASDIDLWEINEGFAGIVMKFVRELEAAPDRVNVNGGGIALGHAMGATGVNLLSTLMDELERRDLNTGLIAISGAAGIGGALIIERTEQL